MKFGGKLIQGDLDTIIFLSHSFSHFKMVEVQIREVIFAQQN
jgi:hypothetical protein